MISSFWGPSAAPSVRPSSAQTDTQHCLYRYFHLFYVCVCVCMYKYIYRVIKTMGERRDDSRRWRRRRQKDDGGGHDDDEKALTSNPKEKRKKKLLLLHYIDIFNLLLYSCAVVVGGTRSAYQYKIKI